MTGGVGPAGVAGSSDAADIAGPPGPAGVAGSPDPPGRPGAVLAWVAAGLGVLFAAVSAYWALGGTWLLDTVGGSLAKAGRRRDAGLIAVVWTTVVLKLIAAALGLAVIYRFTSWPRTPAWTVPALAWTAAVILTAYGAVLTFVGLLLQSGVLSIPADADHHALRWHAFFWDPWFLIWGVALTAALIRHRGAEPRPSAEENVRPQPTVSF